MDAFNYLSVLVSIILGLGITQLLSSIGRAIEHRDSSFLYWPSIAWFFVLLLAHIQTWWAFYGLREHANWSFVEFLLVLLQPIGLYLLAVLVLPSHGTTTLHLKSWYQANSRVFFSLLALFLGFSVLRDWVISGGLPAPLNLAFQVGLFSLSICAAIISKERFHKALALLAASVFVLYIYALFYRLGA